MKSSNDRKHAWIILNAIPHIGPVNLSRLLQVFDGDPERILSASLSDLKQVKGVGDKAASAIRNWEQGFDLERELKHLSDAGADFVSLDDERYPEILKTLYDPPIGFYQKGTFRLQANQPTIAIVGSRRSTLYGTGVARTFAQRLASMGFCIVSGMARGIDTYAHRGALEAGGDTIAVLGNGLDRIYPPENLDLYRSISETGAILSEFCFGRRADRQTFPMRNRIVSGLSDGVLVVESDLNGGSMITAKFALEQNRQVYAIPGRIDQSSSKGCHQLIKEGAILTTSIEDILDDLKYRIEQPDLFQDMTVDVGVRQGAGREQAPKSESDSKSETASKTRQLQGAQLEIYQTIKREGSLNVDELNDLLGMGIAVINSNLMMMELQKVVQKQLDGTFVIRE